MRQSKNTRFATLIGYSGLIIWSWSALFNAQLHRIPTLEILTVALCTSFILAAIKLTLYRQWSFIKQPWLIWAIGIIGIYGNDLTFIAAFKYAPPAQVDLINYLWPIMVILSSGLLPQERFSVKHCLAGLLGLMGIYLLITNGQGIAGFDHAYIKGYLLAFLDAIIWSAYTLLSRYYGKTPIEMIGMYCGVGALCSLLGHLQFEATVLPSLTELLVMLAMGLSTSGVAYYLWDYGIKRGNFKLLSTLSYGNPILAILLLIIFQKTEFNWSLSIACVLVVAGAVIGSVNWQALKWVAYLKTLENKLPFIKSNRLWNLAHAKYDG